MKGYCPPTSMGLPITLSPPSFLVYKLSKLYDVTRVTSRRIESWTKFCYNRHPLSKPTTTQTPPQQPYPPSLLPSPNFNNNSKSSNKKMCLSTIVARDDPASVATMEITAGHMGIALATSIPVQHAKTKHQAIRTKRPATTPWAVASPTNLTPYDIQGGVFFQLRID